MVLEEISCPICPPSQPKKLKYPSTFEGKSLDAGMFAARNALRKMHFQIQECTGCKMWISDPAFRGEGISGLYAEAEHHYDSLEKFISLPYTDLLKGLCQMVKSRGRFLEVGGGNGFLFDNPILHDFSERLELELSKEREKDFQDRKSNGKFIQGILKPDTFEPNSISIAAFFHVLDHLEAPLDFLKLIFNCLEPGGGAAAVVHNTKALSSKVLGKSSPILGVWHTFLYNPENLKKLFQKAGFSYVKVQVIKNTYPLWYWADHLPFSSETRKKQRTFLEKTHLVNLPLSTYAGNLGVLAIK